MKELNEKQLQNVTGGTATDPKDQKHNQGDACYEQCLEKKCKSSTMIITQTIKNQCRAECQTSNIKANIDLPNNESLIF